jgi:predicted dehydrogenase
VALDIKKRLMLKFLVIGAGSIGKRHARCLKGLGHKVGFFDIDPARLEPLGSVADAGVYTSLDDALDAGFAAALICTPNRYHIAPAMKAAEKGVHLFVEKPLSDTLEGIDGLIALCESKKLVTLVGCNLRFFRPLAWAKEHLDKGRIGRLLSARIACGSYLPNWHPDEDYSKGYSANSSLGGGVILDSIHELDYMRWLLGDAVEVYCSARNSGSLKVDVEDTASMVIKLQSGVEAEVHLDYLQRSPRRSGEFIGTDGIVVTDFIRQQTDLYGSNPNSCESRYEGMGADMNHMYIGQMRHFIDCVEGKAASVNDLASAKKTLELALAAKESARINMPVKVTV